MIACSLEDALKLDSAQETGRLAAVIRKQIVKDLRRKGAIVAISGGIDSSVTAALCVRALGPERVLGLLMPEAESSGESLRLGKILADQLGIQSVVEDITAILRATACYTRRDEAIRSLVPHYNEQYRCKVVLPKLRDSGGYAVFSLVVESPEGVQDRIRLTADVYRTILAAMNFKQRTRTMMTYYHADRLQYACVGTPNRLEYDQGFFVKLGDGAADLKPIAHLYKSQIYQLAAFLNIPEEIQRRAPTTDTYSLEQSQEEFYFTLPLRLMDLCLYGKNEGVAISEVAAATGLTSDLVERVYAAIESKRAATRYLHMMPLLAAEDPLPQEWDSP
jgi:NAD+ synthase